jgi:hypothetical protein
MLGVLHGAPKEGTRIPNGHFHTENIRPNGSESVWWQWRVFVACRRQPADG